MYVHNTFRKEECCCSGRSRGFCTQDEKRRGGRGGENLGSNHQLLRPGYGRNSASSADPSTFLFFLGLFFGVFCICKWSGILSFGANSMEIAPRDLFGNLKNSTTATRSHQSFCIHLDVKASLGRSSRSTLTPFYFPTPASNLPSLSFHLPTSTPSASPFFATNVYIYAELDVTPYTAISRFTSSRNMCIIAEITHRTYSIMQI